MVLINNKDRKKEMLCMFCFVFPMMALMKVLEWLFTKMFGKQQTTTSETEPVEQTTPSVAAPIGCPFTKMKSTLSGVFNPHANITKKIE